ncbi:MAG: response regulator transcription factor [Clostridia bacterium]|nr:response regulator transcription factor [Clostridia bacterium]
MIYCVEDDNGIRELVIYTLTASGFEARGFAKPEDFWAGMKTEKPELILLDIMLPGEDGISILKKLRSHLQTASIPVIMATAKGTEYDKVIGLDLGADDYLAKPFGMMEMVSRVKAVLRRTAPKSEDTLSVGEIEIDKLRHRVSVNGNEVILTLKEYDLLMLLMENVGIVYTRDKLLERIWGLDFVGETRTVDVHIGTLRTKLGEAGSYIETVRGVGYRMGVGK